jgi:hypothetical protein
LFVFDTLIKSQRVTTIKRKKWHNVLKIKNFLILMIFLIRSRENSILDWFHITKKFQPILNMNILGEEDKKRLEQVKWELWHGKHEKVLFNLTDVIKDMADEEMVSKLKSLFIYFLTSD